MCDLVNLPLSCLRPADALSFPPAMQNDFATEGGTLHNAVAGVMRDSHMLAHTIRTVKVGVGGEAGGLS